MERSIINNYFNDAADSPGNLLAAEIVSIAAERLEGQSAEKRLNIDSGGYRNVRINKRGISNE